MQARCLMLAAAVAGASAVDSAYNPDVMSNEDRMYQLGLWSSVLIILAFFSAVKMVGSIDYSNDILIICNTEDKKD